MKDFVKKNFLFILSFLILLGFGLFSYNKEVNRDLHNNKIIEMHKLECQNGEIDNQEYCDSIFEEGNQSTDFYYMFYEVSTFSYTRYIILVMILFIIVPALYYPSRLLKDKTLSKKDISKLKKEILSSAIKSSLIITSVCLVLFILCYMYLGTFAITVSTESYVNGVPNNLFLAFLIQFLSVFLQSVTCVNLGLIVLKRIKNYFLSIGITYILYWFIEFVLEIFIEGILISNVLKVSYMGRLCSLVNGFVMPVDALSLICPLLLMLITGIIVYFLYRNPQLKK